MPRVFKRIQGRTRGLDIVSDPSGTVESETFTCCHCQHVVSVPPRADPDELGGVCRQCMEMICPSCVKEMETTLKCRPFEKRLEEIEARGRLFSSMGI